MKRECLAATSFMVGLFLIAFAGGALPEPSDSTALKGTQPSESTTVKATPPASATTQEKAKPTKSKSKRAPKAAPGTLPVKPAVTPSHVEVQHILIGFAGSVPGKGITRTKEAASRLAHEILEKARQGADFDSLVRQYTDDRPPGIYRMSGSDVVPAAGEYARNQMVPAFGNVGFAISPGNIDIAEYDPQKSPFGWHVIKRLK